MTWCRDQNVVVKNNKTFSYLTHCGSMTPLGVKHYVIMGLCYGLSSYRRQAIASQCCLIANWILWEHTPGKFGSKCMCTHVHVRERIWKCCLQNDDHSVPASKCGVLKAHVTPNTGISCMLSCQWPATYPYTIVILCVCVNTLARDHGLLFRLLPFARDLFFQQIRVWYVIISTQNSMMELLIHTLTSAAV